MFFFSNIYYITGPPEKVGVAIGNKTGDPSLEVVLPNGNICPKAAHGIPDFDADKKTPYYAGIAEARGVIYLCGGKYTYERSES